MIFNYIEITPQIIRPILPIIVKSNEVVILYAGLIDSGADYCIFSSEIGRKLGVNSSNKVKFIGVGKDQIEGFTGEIEIRIGGILYKTSVIFAEISEFGHGILGQKGFFDHFDVKLSYQKKLIELHPQNLR